LNRINNSEYKATYESFDTVALQIFDVHGVLMERCKEIEIPKLSQDQQKLHTAMGTDLPFLPFSNEDEKLKFSQYARDNVRINRIQGK